MVRARLPSMRAILLAAILQLPMAAAASPPLETGVSLELAQWRAKHYRDIRYAMQLRIAEGSDHVTGILRIDFKFRTAKEDLILDWRGAPVREVLVNDVSVSPEFMREHLVVTKKHLQAGDNSIRLAFESPVAVSGTAVTLYRDRVDGSEYLYTLLVPADASTLFPCFDQPDLKGRFELELELPKTWRAVSNSPVQE